MKFPIYPYVQLQDITLMFSSEGIFTIYQCRISLDFRCSSLSMAYCNKRKITKIFLVFLWLKTETRNKNQAFQVFWMNFCYLQRKYGFCDFFRFRLNESEGSSGFFSAEGFFFFQDECLIYIGTPKKSLSNSGTHRRSTIFQKTNLKLVMIFLILKRLQLTTHLQINCNNIL